MQTFIPLFRPSARWGMNSVDTRLKVLLVEDNPGDADRIQAILSEVASARFEIDPVERLSQALSHLAESFFDVILLDLSLPDSMGMATLTRIQACAGETPIVVLSGLAVDTVALEALRQGADDYLVKGQVDEVLLPRSLLNAVERRRMRAELRRSEERVKEQGRLESEQRLLAEVGALLLSASVDDYHEPLKRIAELVVESMADFCIVDIVDDTGKLRRLTAAAADTSKSKLASELCQFPIDWDRATLSSSSLRTHRSELVPDLPPDFSWGQDKDQLRLFRKLAPRSLMVVPLVAREELYGSLAFLSSSADRRYGPHDLWLAEELARRAALSIENARLYQASQRATRDRDQALGIIAHDLRNPLGSIQLRVDMLLRHPRGEPNRRMNGPLEAIHRAAERMNQLIEDLLDLHRIEAGQLAVEGCPHSAEGLVREAVDQLRPLTKSIELRVDLRDDLPSVVADRERVQQVFSNLIGNAIKHTAEDGQITVGAKRIGNDVCFWVADTGTGISDTDLPHIFDRLWQARKADKRGVGLGLPICKGIVEAHGGTIWVESSQGIGSTFFFTLAVARTAVEEAAERAPRGPSV